MNFKLGIKAFALTLFMLNPCDAARQLDKNLQNPRTVADTSSMLHEMHGQMKLMQEQLGTLKASQQLLSAENAIKNLTPKVRKLEVHLERVEKQMALSATTDDFSVLKNDIYDLKSKLTALINAPDTSADAAISALNPTLDRMQKQVLYLYESMKSQALRNESELNDKMEMVRNKFSQLELELQGKLQELSGASSSLNLVRQALQQNHSMLNALKMEIEVVKNEKMNQIFSEIDQIKLQAKKEDLFNNVNLLKGQFQKLAAVFKNSLNSVEASHQLSEKSLAIAEDTNLKIKEMISSHERYKSGLKVVYKKEKALKEQLDLVKTVVEQNAAEMSSKFEQMEAKMPFDKLRKLVQTIKLGTKEALEQITELKKQQDNEHAWLTKRVQDIMLELQPTLDSTNKAISSLYEKSKALEISQLNNLADLKKSHDELSSLSSVKFSRIEEEMTKINELRPSFEKASKAINHVYKRTKAIESNTLKNMSDLKKQQEDIVASNELRFSDLGKQIQKIDEFKPALEKATHVIKHLYQKSKSSVSKTELDQVKDNLSASIELQGQALSRATLAAENAASIHDVKNLSDIVTQEKLKMSAVHSDMQDFQEKLKALGNFAQEIKSQVTNHQEDANKSFDEKVSKLYRRTEFLYKYVKEHDKTEDVIALKSKVAELAALVTNPGQKESFAGSSQLSSNIDALNAEVKELAKRLDEKDSVIEKLNRRVAFLTRSLKEKLESNQTTESTELNKIRQEMNEKMEKELKGLQQERLVFETLIQRIAALEAAVSPEAQGPKEKE